MRMCQYFPNPKKSKPRRVPKVSTRTYPLFILSCLPLLHICGLGLFPFSGLVCDLRLSRSRRGLSPKAHCQRVSCLIRVVGNTWRTLRWLGAFPIQVCGHHSLGDMFIGGQGDSPWLWKLVNPSTLQRESRWLPKCCDLASQNRHDPRKKYANVRSN